MLGEAEGFTHQAPQSISRDRVAGGFHRDGESDARMRKSVGFHAQREESVVDTPATGIDGIELQFAAQTKFCAET
ncbi:MAG TPA: hypothetical protein VFU13_19940 [Steroidobacteraceae bacterium]|nr:hypothetical protein [Steroidobacteraceae bacterium]